ELVDQPVGRNDFVRTCEQDREQRPLARAAECDRASSFEDFERPENSELHVASHSASSQQLLNGAADSPSPNPRREGGKMRRWALLLTFIAAPLAFAPAAVATPPAPASGNETFTSLTTTLLRVADGNSFFANSATGTITGTITGTWTAEFTTLIRPSGELIASDGAFTCTCSVAGRSGTFTTRFEGTGAVG